MSNPRQRSSRQTFPRPERRQLRAWHASDISRGITGVVTQAFSRLRQLWHKTKVQFGVSLSIPCRPRSPPTVGTHSRCVVQLNKLPRGKRIAVKSFVWCRRGVFPRYNFLNRHTVLYEDVATYFHFVTNLIGYIEIRHRSRTPSRDRGTSVRYDRPPPSWEGIRESRTEIKANLPC